MLILPAIDLRDGKCVRLYQGKFEKSEIVGEDPVKVALSFKEKGAEYIHMVDLDGALYGKMKNAEIISKVVKAAEIPVELGGGIRNLNSVEQILKLGISRVILGTSALQNPDFVKRAVKEYGEKIAVGIDAKEGKVAVNGWVDVSTVEYTDFARQVEDMGVRTIIFTDISKDGTLKGPNLEQLFKIKNAVSCNCNIIASGGIKNIDDLKDIDKIGLYGAITGKAIYTGNIDLKKAIELCK
ncbi:1-(5-phosphoribosyl)-5-[(5-phosphoribosylamino)methylideneamino]imidazole-4-carboxamide isomerase [Clostridium sp. JNZ X4-2]